MKVTTIFFNKQKKNLNKRKEYIENIKNVENVVKVKDIKKVKNIKDIKNNYKTKNLFKFNCKIILIFIIIFVIIRFFLSNFSFNIGSNILKLATNICIDENKNISYDIVKNIYPVFNDLSYIYKDVTISKDETINKDNLGNISSEDKNIIPKKFSDVDKNLDTDNIFNNISNPEVVQTQMSNRKVIKVNNILINNYSNHLNVNYKELVNNKLYFTKSSDKLLFYHTHTSEAYTNSEKYKFDYSSTYRSRDEKFNMISVGKVLKEKLTNKGINITHEIREHDYYTYTTSYTRSRKSIKENLNNNSYAIICDIHRDAIQDLSFAPTANIEGKKVAQLMFVVGVGSKTYPNKYAKDNLALAIKLQLLAEKIYPGLFRPIMIKDYTYNQDMNKYSLLIECGATGNTLDEVYLSMELLSNLFKLIYVD